MTAASRRRGQSKLSAACFIVRDSGGRALAYVYYEDELGVASAIIPATL
jgi:hypothetical protein